MPRIETIVPAAAVAAMLAVASGFAQTRNVTFTLDGAARSAEAYNAYLLEVAGEATVYIHARVAGAEEIYLEINPRALAKLPVTLKLSTDIRTQADFRAQYQPEGAFKPVYEGTSGTITVTEFDATSRVISGTFEFTAALRDLFKPVAGRTVAIKDGKLTRVGFRHAG